VRADVTSVVLSVAPDVKKIMEFRAVIARIEANF